MNFLIHINFIQNYFNLHSSCYIIVLTNEQKIIHFWQIFHRFYSFSHAHHVCPYWKWSSNRKRIRRLSNFRPGSSLKARGTFQRVFVFSNTLKK